MANTKITADNLDTLTTLTVDDITIDGSTISDSGDLTLDAAGDIILDADGGDITFKDGGTSVGAFDLTGGFAIKSNASDADFFIQGNDGGSAINAVQFDMSEAGKATFNAGGSFGGAVQLNDAQLNIHSSSASAIIGSIGNTANDLNIFSTSSGHNGLRFHVNGILPTDNSGTIIDNDADLGDPSYRFKDLHLGGSAFINTKVGIGTASPSQTLSLEAADTTVRFMEVKNSAGSMLVGINGSGNAFVSGQTSGKPLILETNNTERMRIDSSGRLGIGANSPSALLELEHSSDAEIDLDCTGGRRFRIASTDANALIFSDKTASAERMRIDSSGSFEFNTNSNLGARYFIINQKGGSDGGFILRVDNGNKWQNAFNSSGELLWYSYTANATVLKLLGTGVIQSPPTYSQTTSNSANMVVRSSGDFERSTSSKRYKNSITDATKGLTELKTLRPVNYKGNNDGDTVFYGLIAEEVHDAGLTEFVEYNDENQPDGLRYPHMVSLCIKAIQEQQTIIDDLKSRIETLEG